MEEQAGAEMEWRAGNADDREEMTDNFIKCNDCGVFFDGDMEHLVVELRTRYTLIGTDYRPKHYCAACWPKHYKA